jgi:hypothetical protein
LREEGSELPVLRSRPALERVVVALVAAEAHAEEQLRRVLHHDVGLAQDLVVRGRGMLVRRAGGGEDLGDEAVVGNVARDLLADPVAEALRALASQELRVHLQEIRPLVRPVLDELGAADQAIDRFFALDARIAAIEQEGAHLLGLGGIPVRSSVTRRRNSSSVQRALGVARIRSSFLSTSSSIQLFAGRSSRVQPARSPITKTPLAA